MASIPTSAVLNCIQLGLNHPCFHIGWPVRTKDPSPFVILVHYSWVKKGKTVVSCQHRLRVLCSESSSEHGFEDTYHVLSLFCLVCWMNSQSRCLRGLLLEVVAVSWMISPLCISPQVITVATM